MFGTITDHLSRDPQKIHVDPPVRHLAMAWFGVEAGLMFSAIVLSTHLVAGIQLAYATDALIFLIGALYLLTYAMRKLTWASRDGKALLILRRGSILGPMIGLPIGLFVCTFDMNNVHSLLSLIFFIPVGAMTLVVWCLTFLQIKELRSEQRSSRSVVTRPRTSS